MNSSELNKKIQELDSEDFIWIIYLGIIALSYISNHYERKYFLHNNQRDKDIYRRIMIIIFSILIFVYLFFLKGALEDLKSLKVNDSPKKRNLVYLSFIASLLIAISGFIFLYIAFVDDNLDVELAFN